MFKAGAPNKQHMAADILLKGFPPRDTKQMCSLKCDGRQI